MLNNFKLGEQLFQWDVVDLWEGLHVPTRTTVQVTTVNKRDGAHYESRIDQLSEIISQISHPNILKYFKIVQNESIIGIIMEYAKGGCLRNHLMDLPDKRLKEAQARVYIKQIVSALAYLHAIPIVHHNLNLSNLFLDGVGTLKLGDFTIVTKMDLSHGQLRNNSSQHFSAPEVWFKPKLTFDSPAVDIWALGVLLYVMTCGCYPFDAQDGGRQIHESIKSGRFAIPSFISESCASLLKLILHPDPSKRPDLEVISNHPWMQVGPSVPGPPQPPPQLATFPQALYPTFPTYDPNNNSAAFRPLEAILESEEVEPASPLPSSLINSLSLRSSSSYPMPSSPAPFSSPSYNFEQLESVLLPPTPISTPPLTTTISPEIEAQRRRSFHDASVRKKRPSGEVSIVPEVPIPSDDKPLDTSPNDVPRKRRGSYEVLLGKPQTQTSQTSQTLALSQSHEMLSTTPKESGISRSTSAQQFPQIPSPRSNSPSTGRRTPAQPRRRRSLDPKPASNVPHFDNIGLGGFLGMPNPIANANLNPGPELNQSVFNTSQDRTNEVLLNMLRDASGTSGFPKDSSNPLSWMSNATRPNRAQSFQSPLSRSTSSSLDAIPEEDAPIAISESIMESLNSLPDTQPTDYNESGDISRLLGVNPDAFVEQFLVDGGGV